MAAHRKFTFDDPADSYWNANGPANVSLFGDVPSTSNAAAARAALEDLFESRIPFGSDDGSSNTESEPVLTVNLFKNGAGGATSGLSSLRSTEVCLFIIVKENSLDRKFSSKSAASIVSDGSADSFSNNATAQLDYSRLKSEHRKLQKHLEVFVLNQVRLERYRAADPEVTIRRLLRGDSVTLDLYRSKKEKLNLLDAALDSYDGNVIIAVSFLVGIFLYLLISFKTSFSL
ncbi:unnamed protein product [Gongylonema pulchrum]|uniref:SPX domain-containing protein n=1 Tax=Gongylonema pulchrum TaxID=637853 RepID=A0A183DNE5_9BILA|nr:unnamed protein product [Gongylonema pulchrum]